MLRKALIVLAALGALAVLAVVVPTLGSLDWGRHHAAATAALPLFDGETEGLVRIPARGMQFRARVAGLAGPGEGVILLHGFPETSHMFVPLIEAASARGHPVVAFDQRGYSPGARPGGIDAYLYPELVADVTAVADAVGFDRFHLVGHDWGCVVGWGVTSRNPERVVSYTAMSIPHPQVLIPALREGLPSYVRVFTLPGVPEAMLSWGGMRRLRENVYGGLPDEARQEYLAVFSEPGALTAALNWYRGILGSIDVVGDSFDARLEPPVLFVWGTREPWVTAERREAQRAYVRELEELELDAGHSLMQERPRAVVEATLGHIRKASLRTR